MNERREDGNLVIAIAASVEKNLLLPVFLRVQNVVAETKTPTFH